MARRANRAAVLLALIASVGASPAFADVNRGVNATTNEGGVEVGITIGEDGEPVAAASGGGGGSDCEWTVRPYPYTGIDPPSQYGEPPTPEHRLYLVYCDGEFVVSTWLGPGGGTVRIDPVALASTVVEQVPVDLAQIGARPQGRAVTGIRSYFWVEGYGGETITGSVTNGPVTVDVSISLGSVTWNFGDGTPPVTAGLGEAWPARSSVHHTYADRGSYTVTVTIVLPAEFEVNDSGVLVPLPPVVRTATIPYVVDEIQAIRNR